MTENETTKLSARIIISTKRRSRQYSLYDIAMDIQELRNAKGMSEVSKLVGVSAGMLSKFLSVFSLPPNIIDLVKERKIDSVSIVHYLSKFNEIDANKLADLVVLNKLSSHDLRILIPYRKQHTGESIDELVKKMLGTKNIKVSVIKIDKADTSKSTSELCEVFNSIVGKENIINIDANKNSIDIKLSKEGEKILRDKARENRKSLQELLMTIIY